MNRRGFLTTLTGGAALLALAACGPDTTSSGTGSDEPDCDADDLVEGDSDCGGKSKSKTKKKPAKKKDTTKTKSKTGSRPGGRR